MDAARDPLHEYVDVDGARVAYRVAGNGPAIVLIKNNRRPADFGVASLLTNHFRVVQVHPVGFGASDRPPTFAFGRIDTQVLAVMDQEHITDFVVWGFSQTASMAALVARATRRAVAFVAGGSPLIGNPSDATMRRLEREPRLPMASLEFWRAYREFDWHHELHVMPQPKLVYIGTADPSLSKLRSLEPVLRGCGCEYSEFDGLDHTTGGLSDESIGARTTATTVTNWLRSNPPAFW